MADSNTYSWLLHIEGDDPVPVRRVYLTAGTHVVGALAQCEVHLPVQGVSRKHASLEVFEDGGMVVTDLGSRNGTFVLTRRIGRVAVSQDTMLRFGPVPANLELLRKDLATIAVTVGSFDKVAADRGSAQQPDSTTRGETIEERLVASLAGVLNSADTATTPQASFSELITSWMPLLPIDRIEVLQPGNETEVVVASAGDEAASPPDLQVRVGESWLLQAWSQRPIVLRRLQPFFQVALSALARTGDPQTPGGKVSGGQRSAGIELPPPGSLNPSMLDIYRRSGRVARGDIPALLLGDSGAGKEVLARWIHQVSPRSTGPFLAVNCAALPRELLEAELFGIERGVATGVEARPGIIEQAAGGTVFLDEIGDMAPETQAKVLRALEDTSIYRVGGRQAVAVDARFIAATNRPLDQLTAGNGMRQDLFYRLAAFVVSLPPLQQRREDIPLLAAHFLQQQLERTGSTSPGITRGALAALTTYHWPGNVRELENEIAKAVLLCEPGEPLDLPHLSARVREVIDPSSGELPLALDEAVRRAEATALRTAQAAASGDPARAMQLLGISRATYYRKLRELGLDSAAGDARPGDGDREYGPQEQRSG